MHIVRHYFENLLYALRAATLRPFPARGLHTTPVQVLLAMLTPLAVDHAVRALVAWPVDRVDYQLLYVSFGEYLLSFAIIALVPTVIGKADRTPDFLIGASFGTMFAILLVVAGYRLRPVGGSEWLGWVIVPGAGAVFAVVLTRTLAPGWVRAGLGAALVIAGLVGLAVSTTGLLPPREIFVSEGELPATATRQAETPRINIEHLYTWQETLRMEAEAALQPGVPGQTDAFALVLGGTAHESVFLNEVEAVGDILARGYGTGPRTLRLANSRAQPMRHPMANRDNLNRALGTLAAHMDRGEDIALLYLTSHGSEDLFSLTFWEAGTTSLRAEEFADMLRRHRLENLVIVISACHSGSFIDDLEAPDRLIITASAADRKSFGCADGRDWTYWGEAFFDVALGQTRDFREAFEIAKATVTDWETRDGHTPSDPQIWEGDTIGPVLDAWLATLPDREASRQ